LKKIKELYGESKSPNNPISWRHIFVLWELLAITLANAMINYVRQESFLAATDNDSES